jgi:flavin-dependent dehydrogenase
MIDAEVIVVGGGPAGSTCAWKLRQAGLETLVLDKADFPRSKPCAGWITPRVVLDLHLDPDTYPHNLVRLDRLYFHFHGHAFGLPTRQYAIRRCEFDDWLLKRAAVPVHSLAVSHIRQENGWYIVEDAYRSRHIVGAGGTHCPVFRTFFKELNPRSQKSQITAIEDEFTGNIVDSRCHLWFSEGGLPGYSWYVPKNDGYVNVGIGGNTEALKRMGQTIHHYWDQFVRKLVDSSLIADKPRNLSGYVYYLRDNVSVVRLGNAFIVGDAAGLATRDMGEGIGPAIRSGIRAAEAIVHRKEFSLRSIPRYSILDLIFPGRARKPE